MKKTEKRCYKGKTVVARILVITALLVALSISIAHGQTPESDASGNASGNVSGNALKTTAPATVPTATVTVTVAPTIAPTVTPINISNTEIKYSDTQVYTGTSIRPKVSISYNSIDLIENKDYIVSYGYGNNANNIMVGTGYINIKGINKYSGEILKTFKINQLSLSKALINLTATSFTYTGKTIKPIISSVVLDNKTILATNYYVSYISNIESGTGYILITGKGNYTGTCKKSFIIQKKKIAVLSYATPVNKVYTGNYIIQYPNVYDNGKLLVKNKDYYIAFNNNKYVGKASITFKGIGNYTGTKAIYFIIIPKQVTGVKIAANTSNAVKLSWNKAGGATRYQIYVYSTSQNKYTYLTTVNTNYYTHSKLLSANRYTYMIRGYSNSGNTTYYGAYCKAFTTITKPVTPSLTSLKGGSRSVSVYWSKAVRASGYEVYMATSLNGKYSKVAIIKSANTNVYTRKNLTKGRTYYVKVRAYSTLNGVNYYSNCSSVKSVKAK